MPIPDWFSQLLSSEIGKWVRLSEWQIDQLYQHYDLLIRWNQRMNLTAGAQSADVALYSRQMFHGSDPAI